MGNRAIVKPIDKRVGVYLHWNGGRDSVEAFLKYCELKGHRPFGGAGADGYGLARFMQVVGNFFGGTCSVGLAVGVDMMKSCSPGDNGIYAVDGWKIVGRCDAPSFEQHEYDLQSMLEAIDAAQPKAEQLGKRFLRAKTYKTSDLKVGDAVYLFGLDGAKPKRYEIVGIGEKRIVNGTNVEGIPYINRYPELGADNINNYLLKNEYRATKGRKNHD